MPKIAVIYPAFPHYRLPILIELHKHFGNNIQFFGSKHWPKSSLKIIGRDELPNYSDDASHFMLGRVMLSFGVMKHVANNAFDIYIIHTSYSWPIYWFLYVGLRLRGKRVIHWIHGPIASPDFFRKLFYLSLNGSDVWTYGMREASILKRIIRNSKVEVIGNSLASRSEFSFVNRKPSIVTFTFIGRLRYKKRLDLLVEAAEELRREGLSFRILIVGEGEAKESLLETLSDETRKEVFEFRPFAFSKNELDDIFGNTTIVVSPGEIGLLALEAFMRGCPVITHDVRSKQMPEFDSCIEGLNTILFTYNSLRSLSKVMREVIEGKHDFNSRKIISKAALNWTSESQLYRMLPWLTDEKSD